MAEHLKASTPSETAVLVGDIIADAQKLIRSELELAKVEMKQEWNRAKAAAVAFGAAAVIAVFSCTLFFLTLVYLFYELTELPLWSCYGIVTLLSAGSALAAYQIGKRKIGEVSVIPRQTVQSIKESVKWIQNKS